MNHTHALLKCLHSTVIMGHATPNNYATAKDVQWSKSHRTRETDEGSASENDRVSICWSTENEQVNSALLQHTVVCKESCSASILTCSHFFCPPLQGLAPQHHTNRSTLQRYWKPACVPNHWQSDLPLQDALARETHVSGKYSITAMKGDQCSHGATFL